MERLNKIFADWAKDDKKTELKSEKVELASVADLKKASNKAFNSIEKNQVNLSKLVDAKNKVRESSADMLKIKKELDNLKTDFFKKAKDLGIAPASIEEYKLSIDAQNAIGKAITESEKATK